MTVSTLRPSTTVSNAGVVTGGGGDLDTVLSDDSDTTYVTLDYNESFEVGLTDLTLPSGAVVKQIQLRARDKRTGAGVAPRIYSLGPDTTGGLIPSGETATVWWTTPTTHAFPVQVGDPPYGDSEIDAATFLVANFGGGSGPDLIVYELYLDATYVTQPLVTVTAPTGTITADTTPTVSWTNTLDSDGGGQTNFEIKIFTAAQYGAGGFDPDTSTPYLEASAAVSLTSVVPFSDPLVEGTYRAYVRVAQTVNGEQHWSAWDYEGFTLNVDRPGTPSLALTAEAEFGRIKVDLDDNAGDTTTSVFHVQRSNDQVTWTDVRTVDGDGRAIAVAGVATIYDYEAPNGIPSYYQARAVHDFGDSESFSAWAAADETWESGEEWIKHPTRPELNTVVRFYAVGGHHHAVRQGRFQTLGSPDAIVVSDRRGPPEGELEILADNVTLRERIDELLDLGAALFVQAPLREQWSDRWVIFGEHTRRLIIDKSWAQHTSEGFPWIEVPRPEGNVEEWLDPALPLSIYDVSYYD